MSKHLEVVWVGFVESLNRLIEKRSSSSTTQRLNGSTMLVVVLVLTLSLGGCAKIVTNLTGNTQTIKFQITLSTVLTSGGAIIIPVSPVANPANTVQTGFFNAQNPFWYSRGPNEIQQSELDSLFFVTGRNYGSVNSYYTNLYSTWTDYIYITPTSIKLVKGSFTTSANSYVQVSTLASFAPGTNPINFDVNAGDLNGGVVFTQLNYNVLSMDSNGIVKDLMESAPSAILMQSTFTRTESDSDTILSSPAADNIQTVKVTVQ